MLSTSQRADTMFNLVLFCTTFPIGLAVKFLVIRWDQDTAIQPLLFALAPIPPDAYYCSLENIDNVLTQFLCDVKSFCTL